MSEHSEKLIKRHEGHFSNLFSKQDGLKDELRNYVRAPTFVVSLITTVVAVMAVAGLIVNLMWGDINANEKSIVELAREQGKQEAKQEALENNQNRIINQLIQTLQNNKNAKD